MSKEAAAVTSPSSSFTTSESPGGVLNFTGEGMSDATGGGLSKALGFLPLGLSSVSTLLSMSEAGKAADAQRAAQRASDKALTEMERLQEQNFYEALRVPTEAYDKQFNNMMAANQQAITAIKDDPRVLIGAIQDIQNSTIQGQSDITDKLSDKLYNLDLKKAEANTLQADDLSKIAAEKAKGAQIAAMAAEKAKIGQQQATLQGAGGILTQGVSQIGTYGGLAGMEDKLQGLLGGTSFAKPSSQSTQGIDPKMIQAFMQFMSQQQS